MTSTYSESHYTPNGNLTIGNTFYGNSGSYKTNTYHLAPDLNLNLTKDLSLNIGWDRTFNLYNFNNGPKQQDNNFTSPYGSITYNHGYLPNTKIKWSSVLKYKNENGFAGPSQMYIKGTTSFDFYEYIPKYEYFTATQFALTPMYVYGWNLNGPSGHQNALHLGLFTTWNLPYNFSINLDGVVSKIWYNGDFLLSSTNGTTYDEATYFAMYAWLNYSKELYKFNDKTNLMFNFIGGYDPIMFSDKNASSWFPFLYADDQYEWLGPVVQRGNYKNTYIFFMLPQFEINYNLTHDLTISLFAQFKYSNQVWGDSESDWEIQPQGGVTLSYNF